jgi:nicotinate-nucleotide pyrophosphorylase (carboxylating)
MAPAALRQVVRRALEEDDAWNDVTTLATVPRDAKGRARLVTREPCVVAGIDAFAATFTEFDPGLAVVILTPDGEKAGAGALIATVEGRLRSILTAERPALNFAQRLSGVATLTRSFVEAASGVEIRDTRKTTPGLRALEKAAVRAGGGTSHRGSLSEAILIKDNHIAAAGSLGDAVARAKKADVFVEVECDTLEQVQEALEAGADEILLDNMDLEILRKAAALVRENGRRSEASGGVSLRTVAAIAESGVDSISVGALTHSARAIDLSLEVEAV